MSSDISQAWLCAALLAICLFAALPFAQTGLDDDWSYIFTAHVFAQTGHLIYNGWATAMLGWMIPWGALFAKLFGDSITSIRLSIVPIGMLTAVVYWSVLRRFGLNQSHATFGTLCFVLSPLFLGNSIVFLSDVPAVWSVLLCIYCCQRALGAVTARSITIWLILASLGNLVTGTVRQTAWLGVIVVVPCCGYLLRKRPGMFKLSIGLWAACTLAVVLIWRWFNRLPYVQPESLFRGRPDLVAAAHATGELTRGVLTVALLVLPVTVAGLVASRTSLRKAYSSVAVCALLSAGICAALKLTGQLGQWAFPWLSATVDAEGILHGGTAVGPFGPALGWRWREAIFGLVIICSLSWVVAAYKSTRNEEPPELSCSKRSVVVLLLPLALCYLALLLPRAAFQSILDRYLLLPIAIVLVFLLRWHQSRIGRGIPSIGYVTVAVVALISVFSLHDVFAMSRAHLQLAAELGDNGVPRTQFFGGFEFDGWTQLEAKGYVNNPLILKPAGIYHPVRFRDNPGSPCNYSFQRFTPAIHARYVIVKQVTPCFGRTAFAPVSYRTWLPPGTRYLYVQTLPSTP